MSRTATVNRPTSRTRVHRAQRRRKTTRRPVAVRTPSVQVPTAALLGLALFFVAFAATWFVSSLAGNILLEKARRDRIAAVEARASVSAELSRVRRDLEQAIGMEAVNRFAVSRGMVLSGVEQAPAPTLPTAEGTRVASLR